MNTHALQYLVSESELELRAAEMALKMFTNITTPPPPRPGVPPPRAPPPHYPIQPERQLPPSGPDVPSPPDFTHECVSHAAPPRLATIGLPPFLPGIVVFLLG